MKVNGYKIKRGVDLRGADLRGVDLYGADLYGAKISLEQVGYIVKTIGVLVEG